MPQSPIPVGETLAGKYLIERVIGEGGMGIVVAARHLELEQPVAIKFLLEGIADHEEGAERFRREARAAARIHSDHVVRVLDVGVLPSGIRYMVMEYLEGRDLSEELSEAGPLPFEMACGVLLEAIDAVAQAHSVGIVHRDLKPANLYLARRPDGSQRVKVLDFGISKSLGTNTDELSLTATSAWIGSPLYMAPEQMQSARDVDARADVWSLGAVMYEMLCGRPPYEAESLPQLCTLLLTTDAEPIGNRLPDLPEDLAQVVMGCLVRNRDERIQNLQELAAGILPYVQGGPRLSAFDATELSTRPSGIGSMLASTPARAGGMLSTPSRASGTPRVSRTPSRASGQGRELGATPSRASTPHDEPMDQTVQANTHAAWGGTDPSLSAQNQGGKNNAKWLALAGLFVVVGVVAFFVMNGTAPEPEPEEAVVAAQAVDTPPPSPEVQPAPSPVEPEPSEPKPAVTPEPEEKREEQEKEKDVAPRPTPRPAPQPVRRPVARPAPAPSPAPTSTKTESKDSYSTFGGRR